MMNPNRAGDPGAEVVGIRATHGPHGPRVEFRFRNGYGVILESEPPAPDGQKRFRFTLVLWSSGEQAGPSGTWTGDFHHYDAAFLLRKVAMLPGVNA